MPYVRLAGQSASEGPRPSVGIGSANVKRSVAVGAVLAAGERVPPQGE